jgi:hypothetical protein
MKDIKTLNKDIPSTHLDGTLPRKFGGIFVNWRLIDFSSVMQSGLIALPDSHAQPIIVMGVLVSDPQGRFADYRPIATSCLTGFDLQNMKIETLNSVYSLQGLGMWVIHSPFKHEKGMQKHRLAVSRIARGYRERIIH